MLRHILQARNRGAGVIFITHNPHHAYPVGDRFTILNRGRSLGTFTKAEMPIEQLVQMMAGGSELDELTHELEQFAGGAAAAPEAAGDGESPQPAGEQDTRDEETDS